MRSQVLKNSHGVMPILRTAAIHSRVPRLSTPTVTRRLVRGSSPSITIAAVAFGGSGRRREKDPFAWPRAYTRPSWVEIAQVARVPTLMKSP
jgi:hypothetical protein